MPLTNTSGIGIYYEVTGNGRPLVFLHGLGSSGKDWEIQVDHFSATRRVITVDVRGHGRSSKPPGPYTISDFASDVAGVLDGLSTGPADVVGISLGGMTGFQLAADHPDLVRTLVVVNAVPEFTIDSWKTRFDVLLRYAIVRAMGMEKMGRVLADRLFPEEEMQAERRTMARRWAENHKPSYLAAMKAITGWNGCLDALRTFDKPILFLASDQDYTPVTAKKTYVDMLPNADLVVIDDARHALPMERPEKFNSALTSFLSDHR